MIHFLFESDVQLQDKKTSMLPVYVLMSVLLCIIHKLHYCVVVKLYATVNKINK